MLEDTNSLDGLKWTMFTVILTGESNAGSPESYKCRFPAMINDWRMNFNLGSDNQTDSVFPFGFVQVNVLHSFLQEVPVPWIKR